MIDTLLQITAPINAINDVTFNFGDLITIGGGAVATLTAFIKLQYDQRSEAKATVVRFETIEKDNNKEIDSLKELLIEVKVKKNAMRAETTELIEKKDVITHKRIDAVRDDLKEYTNKTDLEFKELNNGVSEIKGMLTQLLAR
jgi:hypothetical protein